MSDRLVWFVGNRNPSITENIVDDAGVAVDLTGATVKFKAREAGSSTLLVDAAASIVGSATLGNVRYDWTSGDIGANGILGAERDALVWWEVTAGGKTQDLMEALIEVRAHSPEAHAYVELEEFKLTTALKGQTYADGDIQIALVAASRGIDSALGQHFYADPDNTSVRYYSYEDDWQLRIDNLVALNKVEVDRDGNGSYEELWVQGVDFVLEPINAPADSKPWTSIRVLRQSTSFGGFPDYYPNAIKVTGQFGWPSVPAGVKQLTSMIANRLVQRTRQAPFGIIQIGGDGAAVRAADFARDPEYAWLVSGLTRKKLLV